MKNRVEMHISTLRLAIAVTGMGQSLARTMRAEEKRKQDAERNRRRALEQLTLYRPMTADDFKTLIALTKGPRKRKRSKGEKKRDKSYFNTGHPKNMKGAS